jgi:urease accessory protein
LDASLKSEVIFIKESYEAIQRVDLNSIEQLQERYSAMKLAAELYQASLKTGRSLLNGARVFFAGDIPAVYSKIADTQIPYHYAIVYGVVACLLELPKKQTLDTYVYANLASLVSVASRIIPLGQNDAQSILFRLSKRFSEMNVNYEELSIDQISTFAPGLEIASMEHEILYSRLCMS